MAYRNLDRSGLKVSTLTMGGKSWAAVVGTEGVSDARRLNDIFTDASVNFLDTVKLIPKVRARKLLRKSPAT